jgi:uncharacterized protein DUF885
MSGGRSTVADVAGAAGAEVALDRFFQSYYRLRPVNATFTGVHDHDGELPDWSPGGLGAAVREMQGLRGDLAPLLGDATQALGTATEPLGSATQEQRHPAVAAIDLALADAFLEIQIAEHEGDHFQRGNPSLAVGEAIFGVIAQMTRDYAPVALRAERAAARLTATGDFLAGARAAAGARPIPAAWTRRALRELEGGTTLLHAGIPLWIDRYAIPAPAAERLRHAAAAAAAAFESHAAWLRSAPADPAAIRPCGREMLDRLVRRGHCEARPIDALHTAARLELDDASAALDDAACALSPDGWPGISAQLADLHPAADEYLAAFEACWRACRDLAESRHLVTWPDAPIRYVPIPEWTRTAAPFLYYLFYRSPAPFDTLDIHDYVVPPLAAGMSDAERARVLRATNDSVIKLNHVVHHGAIGHHVQNAHAYAGPSRVGQVAAVDCASRIAMFAGGTMAEGWACYATGLMGEVGFLTPLEEVGERHTRVRMLCRAVVDLELHAGAMPFDAAVELFVARAGMPAEAAAAEVVKCSMFPGTAMMYWIGTTGIERLRAACERIDGNRFSLRAFHDELLSHGSIPVPMIDRLMRATRGMA